MGCFLEVARERALVRVGSTLNGKWHLDALIAVGGAAAVFRATHRNGMAGAVKVLHADLAKDRDFVQRFLREGYAANQVGHPGAVKVLDDNSTPDGTHFLVMELLEGESLERLLARTGPLDESFVLWVADGALPVLAAGHERGIIHRDIKPENLFCTSAHTLKILDFGVARMRDPSYGVAATTSRHVMGTPAYMAPEQASGRWEQVDGTSDLWALAASMYALLTGRLLREAKSRTEELMLAMTVPLPSMKQLVPGLSPDVVAIIDRALDFDRSKRFPNADAMHDAVRAALARRNLHGPVAPVHAYRHATAPSRGESTIDGVPAFSGAPSIAPVSSSPALEEEEERSSREITTAQVHRRRQHGVLLGLIAVTACVAGLVGAGLAVGPWGASATIAPSPTPTPGLATSGEAMPEAAATAPVASVDATVAVVAPEPVSVVPAARKAPALARPARPRPVGAKTANPAPWPRAAAPRSLGGTSSHRR